LPSGWLADRFGPRLMVLLSVAGVAIAGLLIGFSHSYATLVVFLVLAALLGGGYHPASGAAISSIVPPEHRGRALGVHSTCGISAFWVVPLIAAPIAVAWGWRGAYITLTIPTIILGILLYILIRQRMQTHVSESRQVDSKVNAAPARINWRLLAPFIIISVTAGTIMQSASSYLSLYAVDNLGVAEAEAAMLMAITPAVSLFAAPLGGYFSDRFGSIPVLLMVSFFSIPLVYLLGLASNVAALAILMFVIGITSSARMPTSESYIVGNTPMHRRATVLGLYYLASTEVSGILAPVLGLLIDRWGFHDSFAAASALMGIVVSICAVFLWRNRSLGFH